MSIDRIPVRHFDLTLLWSVRIQAQGALYALRKDPSRSPAEWLAEYARWLSSGTPWRWIREPYRESFGVPKVHPCPTHPYQEFVYFHPFIQELLYPQGHCHLAVLARDDLASAAVTLSSTTEVTFQVVRAQIHLTTADVAVLAIGLRAADLPLRTAMSAINEIRRVYPPFWIAGIAEEFPRSIVWHGRDGKPIPQQGAAKDKAAYCGEVRDRKRAPVSPPWAALLQPLAPWNKPPGGTAIESLPLGLFSRQVVDDRASVHAYIETPDPAQIDPAVYMRLTFADTAKPDWAYHRDFLAGMERRHWYDRFWHLGSRYLITDSTLILVTNGGASYLRNHMQHHYFQMHLLALMQKTSLLVLWGRLSELLREFHQESAGKTSQDLFHSRRQWLSSDLANYLAVFEFSEVSNQMQGRDLFTRLRQSMGTSELLAELKQQVEFAAGVDGDRAQERLTKAQVQLARIANVWAPIAIGLSALSLLSGNLGQWLWHAASAVLTFSARLVAPLPRWFEILVGVLAGSLLGWFASLAALQRRHRATRLWIVPRNDLEAVTIIELLRHAREECLAVDLPWGARWDTLPADTVAKIRQFRGKHPAALIYGVELAGANPFGAVNVDHHRYADDDRSSAETSLEQAASIIGRQLDSDQRLVAINDRGGIHGMLAAHVAPGKIRQIRARDRAAQRVGPAEWAQAARDLASARREGAMWVVSCAGRSTSAHTGQLWEREQCVDPVLLQSPGEWCYYGPLARQLAGMQFAEVHWSGGEPEWGYYGIERPSPDTQAEILKALGPALPPQS